MDEKIIKSEFRFFGYKNIIYCLLIFVLIFSINVRADEWTPVDPANPPDARHGHTMVTLPDGRVMLFGGEGYQGELKNDLFTYDANGWNTVIPANDPPPKRKEHQAWTMGSKMFVYGGYGESGPLNDMWTYDTDSNEWYEPSVGSKPPARSGHATIPQSDGSILILGGQDSAGDKLYDFWRYSSGSFQQLPDCPRAYSNHFGHMIDEDVLFVFGEPGVIAYYQFSAGMWDLLPGGPPLNGYACSSMAQNVEGQNVIFVFGGQTAGGAESDVVYEFNTITGELTQRVESMPFSLMNSARAEVNSSLFFGGISNDTIINTTLHFFVPCGCVGANYTFVCGQEVNTSCTLNCNLNSNGTCFTAGANNITINGNGYGITGNTTGSGINVTGRNNVTIKNFNVYNFSQGIYLSFSNNNNITNNTASNNTGYDFYSDENSHDNTVKNLTIASYPTTISFTYNNGVGIKGVDTAPPDPADKGNINRYVNATNVTANSWLFLNVSYSDADIIGVDEASLKMHRHNGTGWELADGLGINGVNPALNYVYANITEFSIFAPLGNVTGAPPSITSFAPPSPVNDTICTWRTFNVTVNQTVNVSWYLNNSLLHTNLTTTDANYTLHAEFVGDNNVSAVATNANGADMQTWIWNVTGAPKLCTTPDPPSHDFGIVPPGQTRNWDFEITNCGGPGTTLNWDVTASEPWISVSPSSGTNTIVTVTIDTKLPDGGVKTGTITVNSNGGTKIGVIRVNIELETAPETGYATFATTGGYFDSVDAVAEEMLPEEGKPADMVFPHGFFSFTITGLTAGQSVTVNIVLPSDMPANAEYWKYGPTPDNPTDHWYEFMYDGQTGAEINGNLVTLHFVDGLRGDDNPTPDGQIVDQGAPGSSPIPVPEFNAVGLLSLIGILSVVLAVATLRKRK